ncbi:mitochondrial large subunit ribosomal protein-domain-containing protein [Lophiotrema nucula]|uniref:Large ribosomal subunit protein mL49 n=1 Tax=Lophiotrema nucula TaxID=690887 RepID=A0A6A5ZQS9_9PLEO|nr:mitochondrial large subunit ribosomal protein-domain-containing protein [Lophiotrema nucula]
MASLKPFLPLLRPLGGSRLAASRHVLRFSTASRWRSDESSPATSRAQASKPSTTIPPIPPTAPSTPKEASRAADLAAAEAATDADSAQPAAPKPTLPSQRSKSSKPASPTQGTTPGTSLPADQAAVEAAPDADSAQAPAPKRVFPSKRPRSDKPGNSNKPGKGANPEAPSKAAQQLSAPNVVKPKVPRRKGPAPMKISLPPARYHVAKSSKHNYPIYTDYKRGGNLHLTLIRKITGDLSALRDELKIYLNKNEGDVKVNQLTKQVIVKGHHVTEVQQFLRERGM